MENKTTTSNNKYKSNNSYKRNFFQKKYCRLCKYDVKSIDYKNVELLEKYTKNAGKIVSRRFSGACSKHQKMITAAVKRARAIALLPYVSD